MRIRNLETGDVGYHGDIFPNVAFPNNIPEADWLLEHGYEEVIFVPTPKTPEEIFIEQKNSFTFNSKSRSLGGDFCITKKLYFPIEDKNYLNTELIRPKLENRAGLTHPNRRDTTSYRNKKGIKLKFGSWLIRIGLHDSESMM
jgi:hypothetical protein